jgi:hypothetical protein
MRTALDIRGTGDAAARRDLRAQIAALEARGGSAPAAGGPRLLSLGELEACRDALAARPQPAPRPPNEAARVLLERALLHPERHRGLRIPLAALGEPGCGVYQVRPRFGLIGRLAGWWEVKLSSGCPLAMRIASAVVAQPADSGPRDPERQVVVDDQENHERGHDRHEHHGRQGHLQPWVATPRAPRPALVVRHRR